MEQPTELVLAPQTRGSGYTLLPDQRCPGAPRWTCTTGLGRRLQTFAEQSREAACNRCLPSHTWELPGSDSAGHGQKHARNISCLKTEDFRFPCLGERNMPPDFIAPFISEGAADSGPAQVTGRGTAAAV